MGTDEKLIRRFLKQPKDFTFDEMERLLALFGYLPYNKGKTSGWRIIFKKDSNRPIMLHKPHPDKIVKSYAMKQVLQYLEETGALTKE